MSINMVNESLLRMVKCRHARSDYNLLYSSMKCGFEDPGCPIYGALQDLLGTHIEHLAERGGDVCQGIHTY